MVLTNNNIPVDLVDYVYTNLSNENYKLIKDSKNSYYILAISGMKRSGGYEISIKNISMDKKNNSHVLNVEISKNNPDSMPCIQMITYPYDIKSFKCEDKIDYVIFKDAAQNQIIKKSVCEDFKDIIKYS